MRSVEVFWQAYHGLLQKGVIFMCDSDVPVRKEITFRLVAGSGEESSDGTDDSSALYDVIPEAARGPNGDPDSGINIANPTDKGVELSEFDT